MRSISYGHLSLWPHDGNSDPTIKRWTLEKSNLNSKQHWLGTGFIMDQGLFAYVNSNPEKNKETTVYRSMPGCLLFHGWSSNSTPSAWIGLCRWKQWGTMRSLSPRLAERHQAPDGGVPPKLLLWKHLFSSPVLNMSTNHTEKEVPKFCLKQHSP